MKHLAIFVGDYIEKIFKGEKTIEVRFSVDRMLPYGSIKKGDKIYLKQSGEKILGEVEVDNVLFYENLNGEAIGKLRKEYSVDACTGDSFWVSKAKAEYVSLIFLKNPKRYLAPIKDNKKDRRSWVIMEND